MARGYPDYFGFTMFPWQGTPTEEIYAGFTVPNFATDTMFKIDDKGRTFGGELLCWGNGDLLESVVFTTYIDDVTDTVATIKEMLERNYNDRHNTFLRLLAYWNVDLITYYASFEYLGNVPFGKYFALAVINLSGNDLNGNSFLRWAKTT